MRVLNSTSECALKRECALTEYKHIFCHYLVSVLVIANVFQVFGAQCMGCSLGVAFYIYRIHFTNGMTGANIPFYTLCGQFCILQQNGCGSKIFYCTYFLTVFNNGQSSSLKLTFHRGRSLDPFYFIFVLMIASWFSLFLPIKLTLSQSCSTSWKQTNFSDTRSTNGV